MCAIDLALDPEESEDEGETTGQEPPDLSRASPEPNPMVNPGPIQDETLRDSPSNDLLRLQQRDETCQTIFKLLKDKSLGAQNHQVDHKVDPSIKRFAKKCIINEDGTLMVVKDNIQYAVAPFDLIPRLIAEQHDDMLHASAKRDC